MGMATGDMKKLLIVASALAATLSVLPASADPSPYDWAAALPGCDTSRPAVAHHADQQVLASQPTDGPVACGMLTGWPTVETMIEVTNENAVIYEPALLAGGPVLGGSGHAPGSSLPQGLARTFNEGRTWDAVSVAIWPLEQLYLANDGVDCSLYVDHDTGRLFFYIYNSFTPVGQIPGFCGGGGGATVAFSDDSGTNWRWGFDNDHDCAENPTVVTGKPTISDMSKASYPNVVYLCGDNTSTGAAATGTAGFSCSKSLNGGIDWLGTGAYGTVVGPALPGPVLSKGQGFYSGLGKDLLAAYPECNGSSSSAGAGVQPLPDGSLLVVMSCGGNTYLSKSTDEGATWNVAHQIPHGGSLRADSAGNLYLMRTGGGSGSQLPLSGGGVTQLFLSHSTDGGATWSSELNMAAPNVTSIGTNRFAQGTYAAGQVGHVAVTYYGIQTGNTTSDGFITETRDALDDDPVFWSGQVNSPDRPLLYNTGTANIGITVLDFNGGALSPDGRSAWGSWVQDCGPNMLTSPSCLSRLPAINPADPQDGFAGRLVWPPKPPQ